MSKTAKDRAGELDALAGEVEALARKEESLGAQSAQKGEANSPASPELLAAIEGLLKKR